MPTALLSRWRRWRAVQRRTSRRVQECQLPGCSKSVYVDRRSNKVFDHCGKGHAIQHQNLPTPARPSAAGTSDFQQECFLPGCKQMGSLGTANGVSYDYCSKDHPNEAAATPKMFGAAPGMGSTTTTRDLPGSRAPSSGTFLPPCNHCGYTRPCTADAKTGLIDDACQAHSSGAATATIHGVAGGTSSDPSTQAPTPAATGTTVGIIRIARFTQAPPPSSASATSSLSAPPLGVPSMRCQLDGCAKISAVDTSTGQRYDFCCRDHAQQAKNAGKGRLSNSSGASSAVPRSAECMLSGCSKPQASGFDHCCKDHALLAAQQNIPVCTLRGCVKSAWFNPKNNQVKSLTRGQPPPPPRLCIFAQRSFSAIVV